jgi:ABC-type transporter Mla maintaining outer membrane lipid asymmetry ATPase subunit MlaF
MNQESTAESTEKPIIEMVDVAVSSQAFPDQAIVEEVQWTVRRGEYWVIAGMHGSGKSDFLATTAGLLPPLSGDYRLFGHDMPIFEEQLVPERLRLGMVFEGGQLLQRLTIKDNVALPLRYHRPHSDAHEINRMLELTGLNPVADNLPATVSRSWHKRAGLARALMLRPEILLVDDPLTGLDPRHRGWWVEFLRGLSAGHDWLDKKPLTLIVTTEDLRPWRKFGAHFAILQDKRFTPLGRQADIGGHAQPLVKEFLAEPLTAHG